MYVQVIHIQLPLDLDPSTVSLALLNRAHSFQEFVDAKEVEHKIKINYILYLDLATDRRETISTDYLHHLYNRIAIAITKMKFG